MKSQKKKTQSSDSISKIYKSRRIILKQLEERGFDISDYNNFTINEISIMNKNDTLDMLLKNNSTNQKIYIKYHLSTKIRDTVVYEYIDELFTIENILTLNDDLIIISKENPNDTQIKLMETLYATDKIYFNIFNYNNYLYNILDHTLVPKHRILSKEEKTDIENKYYISKKSEFPEISRFDPVALVIGLRPNQLCEIIRPSDSAINSKYYRLCI
jgi:DNA-directed RNA polymerases I, II, and III subunit RPABC1